LTGAAGSGRSNSPQERTLRLKTEAAWYETIGGVRLSAPQREHPALELDTALTLRAAIRWFGRPVAALDLRHVAALGELGKRRAHRSATESGRLGDVAGGHRLTGGQRGEDGAPCRA
jgi:hypothetical protein